MITACENGCLEIITMRTITIPGPRYNEIQPSDSMHPVSAQLNEEIDKDKNKAQERDSKTYEKPVRAVPIQVRGGRDALQTRSLRLTCILQQVRTSTDSLNCQFVGRPAPPPPRPPMLTIDLYQGRLALKHRPTTLHFTHALSAQRLSRISGIRSVKQIDFSKAACLFQS